ncbi:membrane protein [Azospira sp. I13]|uniref:DMT family transporter n=1 Tax=Azospira sp. I13 TaxID=1765050 RepID=UPI000D49CE33|nr:DMT family transporter [Azospira sp. I13]GBG02881.1 membrane protein [Azospira sp. I13]
MESAQTPGALRRGYFYAALTVAIWSGFILVSRLGGKSPLTGWDVTALRFGTAALILLPVWLLRRPRLNFSWRMVILAITGGCGYGVLVYAGFKLTSAAHGAVLLPGMLPFLVALMAWLVLGERPSAQRWAGLAGIAAGIACLAVDSFSGSAGDWRGDLLILASSLSWAIYTVLVRRWQVAPWDATLGVGLVSALLYLPIYLLWLPKNLAAASLGNIALQAAYQGVLAVIVAMMFFMRAVALLGPTKVGTLMALIPAVAGTAAAPLLGEPLSPMLLSGLALVSLGAWMGSQNRFFVRRNKLCPT